jgi:hypothetical protein
MTDLDRDGPGAVDLDGSLLPRRMRVEEVVSAGECLLYSPARDQASLLNRTSTEIWELCDGTKSIRSIARTLGERYGLDEGLLLADIASAVSMLRERGLVELATPPHA